MKNFTRLSLCVSVQRYLALLLWGMPARVSLAWFERDAPQLPGAWVFALRNTPAYTCTNPMHANLVVFSL
jgi:hypothetical protein